MEENKSILERTVDMVISSVQMGGKETHANLLSVNDEETTKELLALTEEQVFKLLPTQYADLVDHIDLEPRVSDSEYNGLLLTVYRK